MRSQRMRSIAAMSKLQHDAATTIQVGCFILTYDATR